MAIVNGYKQNENEKKLDILNFLNCQIKCNTKNLFLEVV